MGEKSCISLNKSISSFSIDVPLVSTHPVDLASNELVTNNEASADPIKATAMLVMDDGATLIYLLTQGRRIVPT